MYCEEYIPPWPIISGGGLLADRWLGAHIARVTLDRGGIYLCHTIPRFREAWLGMEDALTVEDAFTLEDYLQQHNPPGWAGHGIKVVRASLVLFGDSDITNEYRDIEYRVSALRQSIRDVIDALNRGELTEAIIRETIDERLQ